jgi:predicted nucleic acid-binding protein
MGWLYRDEARADSDEVYSALETGSLQAVVPALFYLEVANTLLMGERKKRTTAEESDRFYSTVLSLPIDIRMLSQPELADVLRLGRSYKLSAYDAAYLHLVLTTKLPLHSKDTDLLAAVAAASARE